MQFLGEIYSVFDCTHHLFLLSGEKQLYLAFSPYFFYLSVSYLIQHFLKNQINLSYNLVQHSRADFLVCAADPDRSSVSKVVDMTHVFCISRYDPVVPNLVRFNGQSDDRYTARFHDLGQEGICCDLTDRKQRILLHTILRHLRFHFISTLPSIYLSAWTCPQAITNACLITMIDEECNRLP